MTGLLTEEMRAWIGRSAPPKRVEVHRSDIVKYSIATEQRLEKYRTGDEAPPMFLFGALRPVVPMDELGPDGLPTASFLPDLPLKRVMAGGTDTTYHRPIRPGDVLICTRTLADMYEKQGSTGPLIFVVYKMAVQSEDGKPIADEIQTQILR